MSGLQISFQNWRKTPTVNIYSIKSPDLLLPLLLAMLVLPGKMLPTIITTYYVVVHLAYGLYVCENGENCGWPLKWPQLANKSRYQLT